MSGDDQVRYCAHCSKHVYNLSALSRSEAEELIEKMEGHLCARYYVRHDGTVLTADCPVGWRNAQAKLTRIVGALVVTILGIFGVSLTALAMVQGGLPGQPRNRMPGIFGEVQRVFFPDVVVGQLKCPPPPGKVQNGQVEILNPPEQNAEPN